VAQLLHNRQGVLLQLLLDGAFTAGAGEGHVLLVVTDVVVTRLFANLLS
jgi:hypothetical protein